MPKLTATGDGIVIEAMIVSDAAAGDATTVADRVTLPERSSPDALIRVGKALDTACRLAQFHELQADQRVCAAAHIGHLRVRDRFVVRVDDGNQRTTEATGQLVEPPG